jgi:hypothetical protein
MKFYMKLKSVGLAIVLMGLSGVVLADLSTGSSGSTDVGGMTFDLEDTGEDQSSLGTCATNSQEGGTTTTTTTVDEPPAEAETPPESFVNDGATRALASETSDKKSSSQADGSNFSSSSSGNSGDSSNDDSSTNPTTPEPATLLIIGMSLVGFVPLVKRYRRKQTTH